MRREMLLIMRREMLVVALTKYVVDEQMLLQNTFNYQTNQLCQLIIVLFAILSV